MSKVVVVLVIATFAAAVAAQGYPNNPNGIPDAIYHRDWDRLHGLVGALYRREFGNALSPVQAYNVNTFPAPVGQNPGVQTFTAPLGSYIQTFAAPQSGPGQHSIGSAVTSFVKSRTGPDGVTTVERGGDGIVQRDGQATHYHIA